MIVVFPMTGDLFFNKSSHGYPKPLIEFFGKNMIEHSLEIFEGVTDVEPIFIVKQQDEVKYRLSSVIEQSTNGKAKTITVPQTTGGALCSALVALSDTDSFEEVFICNYDHVLFDDVTDILKQFRQNNADFGLVSFKSQHPKWSYVKLDEDGTAIAVAEKNPISNNALCGLYYFRTVKEFCRSATKLLIEGSVGQEVHYISHVFNEMILNSKIGVVRHIQPTQYFHFHDEITLNSFIGKFERQYSELKASTKNYVRAFARGDVDAILQLCNDDVVLVDPEVRLSGKIQLATFLKNFFSGSNEYFFEEKDIFTDGNMTMLHFNLTIDQTVYCGVDLIEWENGKIHKITAYLNAAHHA